MIRASVFGLAASAALVLSVTSAAADGMQRGGLKDVPIARGYYYAHIAGTYVLDDQGSGIVNGFDPREALQGLGWWASGYVGYVSPSQVDWRLGGGYAKLRAGGSNGAADPNEYGIDSNRMFYVDADVGLAIKGGGGYARPFVGVRYLNLQQDQGFRPDVPLNCCFMNSEFQGIGPRIGIDVKQPIAGSVSFVGSIDFSVLFGTIEFDRGITGNQVPPAGGDDHRTVLAIGGYAGLDFALSSNTSLGVGYRLLHLNGSSYSNQGFFNPGGPSGNGSNTLSGPSASLTVKF